MTRITTRTTLTFISTALLALTSLQAAAWRGGDANRTFPAQQVSSYSLTIESNGAEADVYYPQARPGKKWLYMDGFPIVIMMQGANVNKEYYSMLAVSVARQGFVVVVPNQTNTIFGGGAFLYAEVHTIDYVMDQMRIEDSSPDSPLYVIADTSRLGIMGHSFGGAATMFAVGKLCSFPFCDEALGFERPAELKAVVLTSSNARSFDFDTTGIPLGMVVGGEEVARDYQLYTYETLETPKAFITIEGANHYGLCDADVPPGASALDGETEQTVPNGVTATRYGYWAGTFLRAHIHNDSLARNQIYNPTEHAGVTIVSQAYSVNEGNSSTRGGLGLR